MLFCTLLVWKPKKVLLFHILRRWVYDSFHISPCFHTFHTVREMQLFMTSPGKKTFSSKIPLLFHRSQIDVFSTFHKLLIPLFLILFSAVIIQSPKVQLMLLFQDFQTFSLPKQYVRILLPWSHKSNIFLQYALKRQYLSPNSRKRTAELLRKSDDFFDNQTHFLR